MNIINRLYNLFFKNYTDESAEVCIKCHCMLLTRSPRDHGGDNIQIYCNGCKRTYITKDSHTADLHFNVNLQTNTPILLYNDIFLF
jgi:hypothetical protein